MEKVLNLNGLKRFKNLLKEDYDLGYTPIQQGGGKGQLSNKIYLGWSGSKLKAQVDISDMGNIALESWCNSAFATKILEVKNIGFSGVNGSNVTINNHYAKYFPSTGQVWIYADFTIKGLDLAAETYYSVAQIGSVYAPDYTIATSASMESRVINCDIIGKSAASAARMMRIRVNRALESKYSYRGYLNACYFIQQGL